MKLVSDISNFGWKYQVRESDILHRKVVLERWSIDDGRRSVDEKMEQLKAIAESSTIIAGFLLSALCEVNISLLVPSSILAAFALATSAAISVTLISAILSIFVLVAIYSFPTVDTSSFEALWRRICEDDWRLALNGFTLGSCLFLVTVSLASWVLYWPHPRGYVAAIIVSVLCFITVIYWYMRVYLKWYVALKMGYRFESAKKTLRKEEYYQQVRQRIGDVEHGSNTLSMNRRHVHEIRGYEEEKQYPTE